MSDGLIHRLPMLFRCWLTAGIFMASCFDLQAQSCALICKTNVQVVLNGLGQALITEQVIAPTAPVYCPGPITISLFDENYEPAPNPLTCDYAGQTITAVLEHDATGNSCTGTIELRDYLPPYLNCPEKFVLCSQDTDPDLIGQPLMSDNCTPAAAMSVNYDDQFTDLPCNTSQGGQQVTARIDRSWQVSDENGNTSACIQKIWVKRAVLSDVGFPPDLDGFQDEPLDCGQDPNDLGLTGEPTLEGQPIAANSPCDLAVLHSDQIINACGSGSYTVLRTWTISDFCGGGTTQHIQVIKLQDLTPPQLTPPDDFTVGTTDLDCAGYVTLPPGLATDDCSSVSIVPSWSFGAGYGVYLVPKGAHIVTYTATDACGNTASATARVTVEDDDPPQVICNADLQVSVSASGTGVVLPQTLDAGSWDNCDAIALSISRDGDMYGPSAQVTCADIGPPLMLYLRAADAAGLENFCQVEVTVRDFIKPALNCPANVTLNCGADFSNLQLTGQAQVSDNCGLLNLVFSDVVNLNACNIGTVARTWLATDLHGNSKTCVQQITLQPVNTIAVVFPSDLTINDCAGVAALQPAATGQPIITGQACSTVSVTFTDQVFATPPPPACFSILRSWKVIEWCTYNGGASGIWEHVQLITVRDHTAPLLGIPPDMTVDAAPSECTAAVTLLSATATDCSGNVVITHNSAFASAPGANASGIYPPGLHQIVFTATDACGNTRQETMQLLVRDQIAPVALCQNNVLLTLDASGTATLSPTQLNAGSYDQCTPSGQLLLDVVPQTFTCAQTPAQPVLLTVTDAAGNVAACQATVSVQAPPGVCAGDTYIINGTIRTETLIPVASVPVELMQGTAIQQVSCDNTGAFVFDDLPDAAAVLRPHNNTNWMNGVSTFDLALISKHILGIQPLNSPYKMIAADANHSNSITTFDIVLLRKLLLGVSDTVEGNTSWRFVDAGFVFDHPDNPFSAAFPETISLDSLDGILPSLDFIGIKTGDVNNSADPSAARPATDDRVHMEGSLIIFPFQQEEHACVELQITDVLGRPVLNKRGNFPSGGTRYCLHRAELPPAGFFYYQITTAGQNGTVFGDFILTDE